MDLKILHALFRGSGSGEVIMLGSFYVSLTYAMVICRKEILIKKMSP